MPQTLAAIPTVVSSAPGKVNLGLRIVGRRADGFHELESLFAPLDLHDTVEVAVAQTPGVAPRVTFDLVSEVPGVPGGEDNLAARAAEAFLTAARVEAEVGLRLFKRVPAAAGLGGGSSDAGAVLRTLAARFRDALTPEALAALALRIGADVPFFLDPRPALVGGVGERVEPLRLPPVALLLAKPELSLLTTEVYRAFDALRPALTAPGGASTLRPPLGLWADSQARTASLDGLLENDLEPAAVRLCPPVARLRERIRAAGALGVGMSGSGPTVFGVFDRIESAQEALAAMPHEDGVWLRVATTVDSG